MVLYSLVKPYSFTNNLKLEVLMYKKQITKFKIKNEYACSKLHMYKNMDYFIKVFTKNLEFSTSRGKVDILTWQS